jgi:hypothetical protein
MHNDYNAWNQLTDEEIASNFRMTLFYLELLQDSLEINAKTSAKIEIAVDFRDIISILKFYLGYLPDEGFYTIFSRIFWIGYEIESYENNFVSALDHLYKVHTIFCKFSF